MSLVEHLEELRTRLLRSLVGAGVGFLLCYGFAERLFTLLMEPLVKALPPASALIYTTPPEAFLTYVKVSLVAGIFLASPYIFYQIWAFVAPGLYAEERRHIVPAAGFSALFFITGALFGYGVVFPFAFDFFFSYATELIRPMPSLREYLSFALSLLFAFGLIFELPMFVFFLARLGVVTSRGMRRVRKYAILGAFIVGAILTPPDVVSQCLMAGPLILLYELSIVVAKLFGKREQTGENASGTSDGASPTGA